jgi:hypothetical protein
MAYQIGQAMMDAYGNYLGNYDGTNGAGAAGAYGGWGGGSAQTTTSQGVPGGTTAGNYQLDTASPIAQQMWDEEQRRKAMQPAQQPYDYSAGTSFGGAATGSPVLPAPPPSPEVSKPMPYGDGRMYAGGSATFDETGGGLGMTFGADGRGWGGSPGYNPNLGAYADDITRRVNQQRDQALLSIKGNFIGQGAAGSGRQGLAEASAISGTADNLAGNLTGMYLQDWTGQQNRKLQNDSLRNSYDLGNRQLDQSQARLGADLFTGGMSGEFDPLRNASGIYGNYTGYGTTTNNSSSGGGLMGLLGGAGAGYQIYQDLTKNSAYKPYGY